MTPTPQETVRELENLNRRRLGGGEPWRLDETDTLPARIITGSNEVGLINWYSDAALIVEAVNALPALLARLHELEGALAWQPIASAPKEWADGRRLLLGWTYENPRFAPHFELGWYDRDAWRNTYGNAFNGAPQFLYLPSPLPQPPAPEISP